MGHAGIHVDLDLCLDEFASNSNVEKANLLLSNKVRDDTDKFVPMQYGDLRDNVEVSTDQIVYTEEYANYVYNLDDNAHFTTVGTSGHWLERSKEANMSEWEQYASDALLGEV